LSALKIAGIEVRHDAITLETYGRDWTRFKAPRPLAVAFPKNHDEVTRVLKSCFDQRIAVVPSGGRTGLSGAAVAANQELVLSLDKLNKILSVNPVDLMATVEAGVVHQNLQDHLSDQNLFWPIDLASKGSCQIGGNLATNAGGLRFIRYGGAREWVHSLKIALIDGRTITVGRNLQKNNSGYELKHLFIGSEGTLGVITEATLKLAPKPLHRSTYLFGIQSIEGALKALRSCQRLGAQVSAFEVWTQACTQEVLKKGLSRLTQIQDPWSCLVEFDQSMNDLDALGVLKEIPINCLAVDGESNSHELWSIRENITETLASLGPVFKFDLSFGVSQLDGFSKALLEFLAERSPLTRAFLFGHAGDGNIHLNLVGSQGQNANDFERHIESLIDGVYTLVAQFNGGFSAEHGIGLLKAPFINRFLSELEISSMKQIKKIFDPLGLLNPTKIFGP
jgi:FAD/FMN-containing dehydrogenase